MSELRLDVFLLSEPQANVTVATLVQNLAIAFKKDAQIIEKMLARSRCLIKADVEPALAEKYRAIIHKAGGTCELKESIQLPAPTGTTQENQQNTRQNAPLQSSQGLANHPVAQENMSSQAQSGSLGTNTNPGDKKAELFCYKCGASINPQLSKCPRCLAPQIVSEQKYKLTAGMLAFFLGGFGIHRFYLGQWWGIFYLIFWGTAIPSIVSVIEAFVFWLTPQKKWDLKYGQVPKSGSTLIIIIVAVVLFVALVGILAAIALPAYSDYTVRAKIQGAMPLVNDTRDKVSAYIKRTKQFPKNNAGAELSENINSALIASIKLQEGANIEVTFNINSLKENNTLILSPSEKNGEVIWACNGGTLKDRFREVKCRGGELGSKAEHSTNNAPFSATKTVLSKDKHLSIEVPNSWTENNTLLPSALLGVANTSEEMYMVILSESKIDFDKKFSLAQYTKLIQTSMKREVTNSEVAGEIMPVTVNNAPAQQFSLNGSIDGVRVGYIVTCIETESSYYRIVTWTLLSRLDRNKSILINASNSIKFKD